MKVWECKRCDTRFVGHNHGGMANIEHARWVGGKNEDHPLTECKRACLACVGRGVVFEGTCPECHGTGRKR